MKLEVFKFSEKIFEVEVPLIELESGAEIFIGRADDCHIVLDDHQISRHHAVLNLVEGALKLRKLSSFGDLNVNGIYLDEASLNEGDKFSIQDFTLYPKNFNVVAQNNEEGLIDEPTAIFTSS
ncbi:MAG: FHA domain-containing protein, partial [Bacteriovoracaceae bacterium]|nr:FHA domain-containing protein [Bacteriovoracaceae bacterium]